MAVVPATLAYMPFGVAQARIKIPHDSVTSQKDKDEYDAGSPTEEEKVDPDSTRYEGETVIQDSVGKTYIDGKEIKEAEILVLIDAMYERQKQNDRVECYLNLDVPRPWMKQRTLEYSSW